MWFESAVSFPSPVAAAWGEWFLAAAAVMVLAGVAFGLFSRAGSEVSRHPRGPHRGDTTGSDGEALDADGELEGSEGRRFPSTRGTR